MGVERQRISRVADEGIAQRRVLIDRTRAVDLARRISGRPEARERRGRVVGTLAVEQHRSVERPVIVEVADLRLQIGIELVARTPAHRCARDGSLIAGLIVDRQSTRLNSSPYFALRIPSSPFTKQSVYSNPHHSYTPTH